MRTKLLVILLLLLGGVYIVLIAPKGRRRARQAASSPIIAAGTPSAESSHDHAASAARRTVEITQLESEATDERAGEMANRNNNPVFYQNATAGVMRKRMPDYLALMKDWNLSERDEANVFQELHDLEYHFAERTMQFTANPLPVSRERTELYHQMQADHKADEALVEARISALVGPDRARELIQLRNDLQKRRMDELKKSVNIKVD